MHRISYARIGSATASAGIDAETLNHIIVAYKFRRCSVRVKSQQSGTNLASTLLDLLVKGKPEGRSVKHGDVMALAFVGAGMHINARIYK